jgi:hypothetical protein
MALIWELFKNQQQSVVHETNELNIAFSTYTVKQKVGSIFSMGRQDHDLLYQNVVRETWSLACPWDDNLSTKTHKQDPTQIWRETTYYVHGIYNL